MPHRPLKFLHPTAHSAPVSIRVSEVVCEGAPQASLERRAPWGRGGEGRGGEGRGASRKALEARAVEAHRAYLDALVVWERALHLIACPVWRPSGHADGEAELRCELAEMNKERRRIAFRDLCDELGHVPRGYGIVLPVEEPACCGPRVPDA